MKRSDLLAAGAALGSGLGMSLRPGVAAASPEAGKPAAAVEPFHGEHQAGIVTPQQSQTLFAAFDIVATDRAAVAALMRRWTEAAAQMSAGASLPTVPSAYDAAKTVADSDEAIGLAPARLTITFGFGAGLFTKDGTDRFGLAARRPEALVDLPRFNGDQLIEAKTGGDLSVQTCANDPQVAFHALRQLARLAGGVAELRWMQAGFRSDPAAGGTPRNLMGFKDGTQVVPSVALDVWTGADAPIWMRGGSYVVTRRIRVALEHWDMMNVGFQEQTFGRRKSTGAPLGASRENDPLPLAANDRDGNPIIAETAHVRVANASTNNGAQMLRRGYSYNDGLNLVAERWPPWHQGMEYDAGLLFVCYQRDPRTSFIPMFDKMSKMDMLNQFATHTGGGLFAVPGGVRPGDYLGQRLFEA